MLQALMPTRWFASRGRKTLFPHRNIGLGKYKFERNKHAVVKTPLGILLRSYALGLQQIGNASRPRGV